MTRSSPYASSPRPLPRAARRRRLLAVAALVLAVSGCKSESKPAANQAPAEGAQAGHAGASHAGKAAEKTAAKAPQVRGEEVSYEAGGVSLKGFLAYDSAKQGKRPGVLVVHEWWGHNDYARDRARELARLGYTALAVDMYGDGKQAAHPDDAKKFSGAVMSDLGAATERFAAAQEVLQKHASTDPQKVSAIGYCFGGGVVLQMARLGLDLDGVASFHGMLGTKTPARRLRPSFGHEWDGRVGANSDPYGTYQPRSHALDFLQARLGVERNGHKQAVSEAEVAASSARNRLCARALCLP